MNIDKELNEIKEELKTLNKHLSKEIELISSTSEEFHKVLIKLSSEHPEYKDLIEFIVLVNDSIKTSHSIFGQNIIDSIIQLTNLKKKIINIIEEERLKNNKPKIINNILPFIKDYKIILITIAIIFASIAFILNPGTISNIVHEIASIKTKK